MHQHLQRISFHFAKTNATPDFSSFDRLPCQTVDGPRRTHLTFVTDHVPQPLVINVSNKNIRVDFQTRQTTVQRLVPVVVVPRFSQLFPKIIHRPLPFVKTKRCAVLKSTCGCRRTFAKQSKIKKKQMSDAVLVRPIEYRLKNAIENRLKESSYHAMLPLSPPWLRSACQWSFWTEIREG